MLQLSAELVHRAAKIKLLLTDCDGVLTDGGVYYGENGELAKRFNIRDGMGVERLVKLAGIETGIVTGERSPSVVKRAEKLGISECHLFAKDKQAVLESIMQRKGLVAEQVAFIGDDVNDLPAFAQAGLTACPSDAVAEIKQQADVILTTPGGHGAFRELAELLIIAASSKPA